MQAGRLVVCVIDREHQRAHSVGKGGFQNGDHPEPIVVTCGYRRRHPQPQTRIQAALESGLTRQPAPTRILCQDGQRPGSLTLSRSSMHWSLTDHDAHSGTTQRRLRRSKTARRSRRLTTPWRTPSPFADRSRLALATCTPTIQLASERVDQLCQLGLECNDPPMVRNNRYHNVDRP